MALIIISIAILFFLGHALSWFFEKTKIPDLLILVILGYTLGPILGILDASDFGKVGGVIATTALIVILYEGGLHLKAKDLLYSSLPALGLTFFGFISIVICGTLVAYLIGLQSWPIALLLGLGIGSTSSAIVIPMVKPLSMSQNTKTILSLESAFTDVLTIVLFLVILDSVVSGHFSANEVLVGVGPKTIQALLLGLVSGMLWAFIKKKFDYLIPKAFAGEAWALLTYGAIEFAGFNGAIGVLALGFTLANNDLLPHWIRGQIHEKAVSREDLTLLAEITFLLRTFFFIYLGLLIKFSNIGTVLIALLLTILIFVTRFFAVKLLYRPNKYSRLDAMASIAMGPRGLACAVVATLPLQQGVEGGEWLQNVVFALIPMSIFFTAVFVSLSENKSFREKFGRFVGSYPEAENLSPAPTGPSEAPPAEG